jgi:two-component system, NtrC family, response regulator GlrR
MGFPFEGFTPTAEKLLAAHPWPGNIRELQNRIEHAVVVSRGGRISGRALFPEREEDGDALAEEASAGAPGGGLPSYGEAKASFERTYLERVLTAARGNIAQAARLASKSRTEVYALLKKHGLDPGSFKDL